VRRTPIPWLLFAFAAAAFAAALWRPDAVAWHLGLGEVAGERRQQVFARQTHLHLRRLDANTPRGAVLFVGASTVQGLNASRVAACHANFGIGGETTAQVARRLPDYRSLRTAGAVVMSVGLNDALSGDVADIDRSYRRLLDAVPAGIPVVMSSVQPPSPDHPRAASLGPAVDRTNRAASAACAARAGCVFVDFYGAVPRGSALWEPDGIHLSPAGYALWARLLRDGLRRAGVAGGPCMG